jgi:hypothetical protein
MFYNVLHSLTMNSVSKACRIVCKWEMSSGQVKYITLVGAVISEYCLFFGFPFAKLKRKLKVKRLDFQVFRRQFSTKQNCYKDCYCTKMLNKFYINFTFWTIKKEEGSFSCTVLCCVEDTLTSELLTGRRERRTIRSIERMPDWYNYYSHRPV